MDPSGIFSTSYARDSALVRTRAQWLALALFGAALLLYPWLASPRLVAVANLMLVTSIALATYVAIFFKELRAILFSRVDAEAAGIRATVVWTGFLILTAATLTVNFQTVGGLMIYSLICNPAAAAFQLTRGCGPVLALAAVFGAASGLGGFLIAAATDLPSGAVIVLVSSALLGVAALIGRRGRH